MSPHLIQRLKRKSSEELESTAESHSMFASKRPRVEGMDTMPPPRIFEFNSQTTAKIMLEFVRARRYFFPYDNPELKWEDNLLWSKIIENLELPVRVLVDDLKMTMNSYYQIYQQDQKMSCLNLPDTYMEKRTLDLVGEIFKVRRSSISEYLDSLFNPPPCQLAIEFNRGSSSTGVSYGHGFPGMIQPLQSYHPSNHSSFLESFQEVEVSLSEEEKMWAEYDMTRYQAQIAVFCASTPEARIKYVKKGCAREKRGSCG